MSNNLMKKPVEWNVRRQQCRRATLSAGGDRLSWKFEILANRAKSYGETHGNIFSLLDHASKYTAILTALLKESLYVYITISNTNIQWRECRPGTETFEIELDTEVYLLTC